MGFLPPEEAPQPAVDLANDLLPDPGLLSAAKLTTVAVPTPHGDRLVFTVRTADATLTLQLDKTTAQAWARQIAAAAASMRESALAAGRIAGV